MVVERNDTGNLGRKAVGGVAWMFLGVGAQQTVQLAVLAILARLLLPHDFGIVSASMVIMATSTLFVEVGIAPTIMQLKELSSHHVRLAYTLSACFGVLIFASLQVFAKDLSTFMNIVELESAIKVFAISFLWLGFAMISEALLARELKFKVIAKIKFISYFIGYGVFSLIFAYNDYGYWSLVFGNVLQNFVSSLLMVLSKKPVLSFQFKKEILKDLLVLSGGFSLAKVINFVGIQGDKIISGKYLGATALGYYGKAYELMVLPTKIYDQVVSKVALASLSKIQGEQARLREVFYRSTTITAFFGIPGTIFLSQTGNEIIYILFGPNWGSMIEPFYFLSFAIYFRLAYRISSSIILAKGLVYQFALTQFVFTTFVLFGAYYAVITSGIVMLSQFVLIAVILNYIILTLYALYLVKSNLLKFLSCHIQGVFIGGLIYFSLSMMKIFKLNNFLHLLTAVLLLSFIYLLTVIIPRKYFLGSNIGWFLDKTGIRFRK